MGKKVGTTQRSEGLGEQTTASQTLLGRRTCSASQEIWAASGIPVHRGTVLTPPPVAFPLSIYFRFH